MQADSTGIITVLTKKNEWRNDWETKTVQANHSVQKRGDKGSEKGKISVDRDRQERFGREERGLSLYSC